MTILPAERLAAAGLDVRLEGAVLTVTLDKPERRNSQTPRMWHALADLGAALPDDVRVVVLRGAGESFSAGIDTRLLAPGGVDGEESVLALLEGGDERVLEAIDGYQRGFTWLADPRIVSVAAVHGYAIGAGFQLALACDLRVVADDVRFCMKEPALGLVPDLAGTKPLVEVVGYSRALEICATARYVEADEARQLGIATAVVPRGSSTPPHATWSRPSSPPTRGPCARPRHSCKEPAGATWRSSGWPRGRRRCAASGR